MSGRSSSRRPPPPPRPATGRPYGRAPASFSSPITEVMSTTARILVPNGKTTTATQQRRQSVAIDRASIDPPGPGASTDEPRTPPFSVPRQGSFKMKEQNSAITAAAAARRGTCQLPCHLGHYGPSLACQTAHFFHASTRGTSSSVFQLNQLSKITAPCNIRSQCRAPNRTGNVSCACVHTDRSDTYKQARSTTYGRIRERRFQGNKLSSTFRQTEHTQRETKQCHHTSAGLQEDAE